MCFGRLFGFVRRFWCQHLVSLKLLNLVQISSCFFKNNTCSTFDTKFVISLHIIRILASWFLKNYSCQLKTIHLLNLVYHLIRIIYLVVLEYHKYHEYHNTKFSIKSTIFVDTKFRILSTKFRSTVVLLYVHDEYICMCSSSKVNKNRRSDGQQRTRRFMHNSSSIRNNPRPSRPVLDFRFVIYGAIRNLYRRRSKIVL